MKDSLKRDIDFELKTALKFYPVILIIGPYKTGKTTLLKSLKTDRAYVDLKRAENKKLAAKDPEVLLTLNNYRCLLDNIDEGTNILRELVKVKNSLKPGSIIMSTSNEPGLHLNTFINAMDNKIAIFRLSYLSHFESNQTKALDLNYKALKLPAVNEQMSQSQLLEHILNYGDAVKLKSLVEELNLEIIKTLKLDFDINVLLAILARFSCQSINIKQISSKIGLPELKTKSLISFLDRKMIIFFIKPYYDENLKFQVKSERMYFYSTRLLCSLLEIKNPIELLISEYKEEIIKNYVINQIIKQANDKGENYVISYFENTNRKQVDLIIEEAGLTHLILIQDKIVNEKTLKGIEAEFNKGSKSLGNSYVITRDIITNLNSEHFSIIPTSLIG